MEDFKSRQAEHFKVMIQELKKEGKIKSQEEFAQMIEVTPASVCNWKSGKYRIDERNAETINRHFPQYPIGWLMGRTDARNHYEQLAISLIDASNRKKVREQLLDCLAYLNGWCVEEPRHKHRLTMANIDKHSDAYIEGAVKEGLEHCADLVRGEERIPLSLTEYKSLIDKMVGLFEFEITHRF